MTAQQSPKIKTRLLKQCTSVLFRTNKLQATNRSMQMQPYSEYITAAKQKLLYPALNQLEGIDHQTSACI